MTGLKASHKLAALGALMVIAIVGYFALHDTQTPAPAPANNSDHQPASRIEPQLQSSSAEPATAGGNVQPHDLAASTVVASTAAATGEPEPSATGAGSAATERRMEPALISTPSADSATVSPSPDDNQSSLLVSAGNSQPAETAAANASSAIEGLASSRAAPEHQTSQADLDAWQAFKLAYNKTYMSAHDAQRRQAIFEDNHRFITEFNERRDSLYKLGVNRWADLTSDEINRLVIGPQMSWPETMKQFQEIISRPIQILSDSSAHSSVDWRNLTGEVVDRGNCLESAVFAAVSNVEAAHNSIAMTANPTAPTKLSEHQVLDCLAVATKTPVCAGLTSMIYVFDMLQRVPRSGLASSQEYAHYLARQTSQAPGQQPARVCEVPVDLAQCSVNSFVVVHRDNMPEALVNSGPLSVALDASQPTFHFYKSGLYHDDKCSPDTYNHHALLVGYSAPGAEPASYLVRHSFGPGWGEAGYMRMLKDEQRNKCLPQNLAIYPNLAQT